MMSDLITVYHGTNYEKLVDNRLEIRSYVTTDKWCAESYGKNIFTFKCNLEDLLGDYFGLPKGVETNIFRTKKILYPISESEAQDE